MATPDTKLALAGVLSALGAALLTGVLAAGLAQASLGAALLSAGGAACVPIGALALAWGQRESMGASLGPANAITLLRGSIGASAAGMGVLALFSPLSASLTWTVLVLAMLALALDGLDGWVARRMDCASPFGGRLDMELDGMFTIALSFWAWSSGAAGAWILLSGALRPLFIVATRIWPWMDRPLFQSEHRRVICVVQIATLIGALSPLLAPWSAWIAAIGLLSLIYSFGIDTLWLIRRRELPL